VDSPWAEHEPLAEAATSAEQQLMHNGPGQAPSMSFPLKGKWLQVRLSSILLQFLLLFLSFKYSFLCFSLVEQYCDQK